MNKLFTLVTILFSFNLMGQTPCENGVVSGYPCNQVDLYAHLNNQDLSGTTGVQGSDIWGWTDPQTNKEYVLMGQTNGVVFVDISNPSSPNIIGRLPSHTGNSSAWRDVKVYNNHAFVVADNNSGHGMQVFDLTRLRDAGNSVVTFNNDAHYDGVSSAHNVVINEETGFAYIVGARNAGNGCGQGGLHIVNIQDPKNPIFAGCFDVDGYTHDAQCVIYNGPDSDYQGEEICFNANENTVTIANVTDKENTVLISKQGFPLSEYSHQGWLTEDHQYFISGDELDEGNSVSKTRTLVWDVRDLDNPVLLTQYYSDRVAIDHNLYIKDDMIFQSNYTDGLIILDSKKVGSADLRELAYFDTFPQSQNTSFFGTWSNYPFFESGLIAVSDITNGLFLLEPNIKDIVTEHPNFTECGSGQKVVTVGVNAQYEVESFQWQAIDGDIQTDLRDDDNFSGVQTSELTINSITESIANAKFRCIVQLSTGEIAYSYLSSRPSGLPEISFSYNVTGNLGIRFANLSNNADSLVWDFGDGSELSNAENPIHTYDELKEYTVTLTGFNNCGEQSFSEILAVSVLNNRQEFRNDASIYPNPIKDVLRIRSSENSKLSSYKILDISGRTVLETGQNTASTLEEINTSNWEAGMYLVLLTFEDGGKQVRKIIKE
jgi:choice-of-anchor B domain-containing protein